MGDYLGPAFISDIQNDHVATQEVREISPVSRNDGMVEADPFS